MRPRPTWRKARFPIAVILALLIAPQPASPRDASGARSPRAQDERLKQVVSSRVVDQPLRAWLERLAQETGVRLKTAPDYEDRALTVRVKAMPLGELMEAVASLYGDTWRRGRKQDDADYVLEASHARRSRQQRFLQTYRRVVTTEILRQANDMVRYGDQPWLFDALPEPERTLRRLEYRGKSSGKVVSLLGPERITRILAGENIILPAADTPGALGEALRELVGRHAMPSWDGWTAQDQATAWVVFTCDAGRYQIREGVDTGLPQCLIRMDIGPPGRIVRQAGVGAIGLRHYERMRDALAPLQRDEEPDPRERRRKGAAFLPRTLPEETKPADGPYAERSQMLAAIADAAGVNLIADSHTWPRRLTPPLGGHSVEEALVAVCDLWQSHWRVEHSTVLVRSRYWWVDDPAEPPATAAAEWQATFQAKGVFPLEEAARIAVLPYEQQQRLALRIPEARAAFSPWLRLYGLLDAAQKAALRSPRGLDLRTVPAPERLRLITAETMKELVATSTALAETVSAGKIVLKLREEARQGRPTAVFSYAPLGMPRSTAHSATVWLPYRASRGSGETSARGAH